MRVVFKKLGTANIMRIALAAICDPRSVSRVLNGEHVKGEVGERIRQALIDNGYLIEENDVET